MESHERPQTARRLLTAIHRRSSDFHDVGAQTPSTLYQVETVEAISNYHDTEPEGLAESTKQERVEQFPETATRQQTPPVTAERDRADVSGASSRSASMDVSVSSVSGADEQTSTIPSSKTSSTKISSDHILAFQSDPSLPALLSGASSVSADMEAELLCRPGIVSANPNLLETTDSLTPPAIGKEPIAGFPLDALALEATQAVDSGIISVPAIANSPAHGSTPRTPSTPSRQQSEREDDDDGDSDSDEGLTMMSNRRKSSMREAARSRHTSISKRRGTNASSASAHASDFH
jgi:[calcium/calmodulin-dependent protein kinase] kinase